MSEQQLRDDLIERGINKHVVQQFLDRKYREQDERVEDCIRLVRYQWAAEARTHIFGLHNYLQYKKLFLGLELYERFAEMDKLLNEALSAADMGIQWDDNYLVVEARKSLEERALPLAERIKELIQDRLGYEQA